MFHFDRTKCRGTGLALGAMRGLRAQPANPAGNALLWIDGEVVLALCCEALADPGVAPPNG